MALTRKMRALAVAVIFFIAYYLFLFDLVVLVKDNIVGYLESRNLTTVIIPIREWNGTAWVSSARQFDLSGFIDVMMTIAIVILPLLVLYRYLA